MAIVYTTNVGVGKELSKDCSLPVPTVGYTNSDEGGLPFRMTRKSIPTTLLLLIEIHGLLLFLHRILNSGRAKIVTGNVDEVRHSASPIKN